MVNETTTSLGISNISEEEEEEGVVLDSSHSNSSPSKQVESMENDDVFTWSVDLAKTEPYWKGKLFCEKPYCLSLCYVPW